MLCPTSAPPPIVVEPTPITGGFSIPIGWGYAFGIMFAIYALLKVSGVWDLGLARARNNEAWRSADWKKFGHLHVRHHPARKRRQD